MIVRDLVQYAEDALGGPLPSAVSGVSLVNQAGRFIESMRSWRYLSRSTKAIAFRDPTEGSSATLDLTANTLTLVGGFTSYEFVPGDTVQILISGTSFGVAKITGRTDDDEITVESTLTGGPFTVDFTTDTARVELPSDFGRLVKVFGVNGFTRSAFPASPVELMDLDTWALTQNNFVNAYALEWNQATAKSTPVPTLKVWPEPSAQEFEALAAIYLRKWPDLTGDADQVPIPPYMEPVFINCVRKYARGYDGAEQVDLDAVLASVLQGPLYEAAVREDGAGQKDMGRVMHRAVRPDNTTAYDPLGGVRTAALFDSP